MKQKRVEIIENKDHPPPDEAVLFSLESLQNFDKVVPQKQHHLFTGNGYMPAMRDIKFEIVTDIVRCQSLWEEFSPKRSLFDTWEFRNAFWQGYKHKPHFVLLRNDKTNLGLLPLWYESDKEKYFWFGSWWQEDNSFLVKDLIYVPLLLAAAPTPLHINAIDMEKVGWIAKIVEFEFDDPKYVLELEGISSLDDFLNTLKKKKRYNLRRDKRIIEDEGPVIGYNQYEDFEKLIELSKNRFMQKGEDTDWEDPRRVKTFRKILEQGIKGRGFDVRMMSVRIGGYVAAVDLIAIYNGIYYPLKCGYDVAKFPGIGNYVNLLEIEDAISLGMNKMDFLEISYGWKDKWFQSVPLYKFEMD